MDEDEGRSILWKQPKYYAQDRIEYWAKEDCSGYREDILKVKTYIMYR